MDTSHPESKAVSTGEAEIEQGAGDQLLPGRKGRIAPVRCVHRQCDSLGMQIKSVTVPEVIVKTEETLSVLSYAF